MIEPVWELAQRHSQQPRQRQTPGGPQAQLFSADPGPFTASSGFCAGWGRRGWGAQKLVSEMATLQTPLLWMTSCNALRQEQPLLPRAEEGPLVSDGALTTGEQEGTPGSRWPKKSLSTFSKSLLSTLPEKKTNYPRNGSLRHCQGRDNATLLLLLFRAFCEDTMLGIQLTVPNGQ